MFFKGALFCCLCLTLLFAQASAPFSNTFDAYLVQVILNQVAQPGFYHCYLDEKHNIWLPEEELEQLKFPKIKLPRKDYRNKHLKLLNAYQELKVNVDKNKLSLSLETPLIWEKENVITPLNLYNGKIRPTQPGFFLTMISPASRLVFLNKIMQPALARLAILTFMVLGRAVFY